MITEKIGEMLKRKIKRYPQYVNRASSLGHPCERFLVYKRTRWNEELLYDEGLQAIFDMGNKVEDLVIGWLKEAGLRVYEQQQPFEDKKVKLSGSIDLKVSLDGEEPLPCEIKSINPFDFITIKTLEDMTRSSKTWLQKYPAQMQLYLFLTGKEKGILLLVNKSSAEIREIEVTLDYDYVDMLLKKAERINSHCENGTLPERIEYSENGCGRCSFRHICLPDTSGAALEIDDNLKLMELLKRREELQPASKELESVDTEIKTLVKGREKVACGDYLIMGKQIMQTRYNVPDELKKQYAEKSEYWKVTITNLRKDGENAV